MSISNKVIDSAENKHINHVELKQISFFALQNTKGTGSISEKKWIQQIHEYTIWDNR